MKQLACSIGFMVAAVGVAHAEGYTIQEIPTLGGARSFANRAVCGHGVVVAGAADTAVPAMHAIMFTDGAVTDLGTLGRDDSFALDGNARGMFVGASDAANAPTHGFVWIDGTMIDLGGIAGGRSRAAAINERGQIVGTAIVKGEVQVTRRAVLWEDGRIVALPTLGGADSDALGINERGEIVGASSTSTGAFDAVIWTRGGIVDLGPGLAAAINHAGNVAGNFSVPNHAALWKQGTAIDLGTFGGLLSFATDLDDHDHVVGWSSDANGDARAFLYRDGTMIDLNTYVDTAHWMLTGATGICNDGTIVGNGLHDGVQRGFVLVPAR